MSKLRDLTGRHFGRLTVTPRWEHRPIGKQKRKYVFWLCLCSCGNSTWVYSYHLHQGTTISCGCFRREILSKKGRESLKHGHAKHARHGHVKNKTYRSWQSLWTRTTNRKHESAHRYVKRGITVDPRWKSFAAFLTDMGERPPGKTLHRINNNLGYSAENCKWEAPSEQARNRCNTKLTFNAAVQIALRTFRDEQQKTIADDFAISQSMVNKIITGRNWRDAFLEARAIYSAESEQ